MVDLRKNLIERRWVELDRELAQHYLTFNTLVHQRRIRPLYVQELVEKMRDGRFRFGEMAFAIRNGKPDLMLNGQHVCWAVIEADLTVPCVLEKFRIDSDLDISEAFRQFDLLIASVSELTKIEAHALKLDWPDWVPRLIVAAASLEFAGQKKLGHPSSVTLMARRSQPRILTREDKVKLLGKYLKEGAFLNELVTFNGEVRCRVPTAHIARAPVAMIIMQTCRIDEKVARDFWVGVRDGENLKRDMPQLRLRDFLRTGKAVGPHGSDRNRPIANHEFAYRSAVAWNAFRRNKSTNLTYHRHKSLPKLK